MTRSSPLTRRPGRPAREVTATIVTNDDKHFTELTIATDNGEEHLTAVYEHPFWSISEHEWVAASDLKPLAWWA
ncbi:hypothetical protein AB0C70_42200 [Streptomyces sp. NPDC048564]|uniref:hypothetical protein n=1 Tax=Streptomyces sp. NPDC048564 TaxID=3155760 RepID=UPI003428DC56